MQLALASQAGMEPVDLAKIDIPDEVIDADPRPDGPRPTRSSRSTTSRRRKLLTIAMDNPDNFQATDDLQTLMGFKVKAMHRHARRDRPPP